MAILHFCHLLSLGTKKRQSIRETAFKKELKSKKLNQKINYKAKSGLQNQKCKISALRNTDKKKR